MRLVVFGLSVSSAWGNGHATLWRALIRALAARGHDVVFFEKDVPYYAAHRDCTELPGLDLRLYPSWADVAASAAAEVRAADVAMVTSYCADGVAASEVVLEAPAAIRTFYDLDTPITLERLARGEHVEYLPPRGLGEFDLVLSYTGGQAIDELRTRLGARHVVPLYGHVDPGLHRPESRDVWAALSYLGTYAADRQPALERLFLEPARRRPAERFVLGGSMYPQAFGWLPNVWYVHHVPPEQHRRFYGAGRLTLNITRRAMAEMGYCPSGRLFEAAACGIPILSDSWNGLDTFLTPDEEILVADTTDAAMRCLDLSDAALERIAAAARTRTLDEHTAAHRAVQLERDLEAARANRGARPERTQEVA